MPLGRRTHNAGIVINEGGRASSSAPPRFVKPKTEPGLAAVKTEPGLAAVKTKPKLDDEAAMKWAREDWARLEMERQRRALPAGARKGASSCMKTATTTRRHQPNLSVWATPGRGSSSSVKKEKDDGGDGGGR